MTTHRLLTGTLLAMLALSSACSAYGFRDRQAVNEPEVQGTTPPFSRPIRFVGIRAPASRHMDLRLANARLSERLQSSCPHLNLFSAEHDAGAPGDTLSCLATAHHSRGAANAVWSNVLLECTLTAEDQAHPAHEVSSSGQQMLSPATGQEKVTPEQLSPSALASTQQMADTDALLHAIASLPCPTTP